MTEHIPVPEAENVARLFRRAEQAIKKIEITHGDVVIPAVNQLRYAGFHLCKFIATANREDLVDAAKHCRRASFDADEAGIIFLAQEFRRFQYDYHHIIIPAVFPDYIKHLDTYENTMEFIKETDKDSREEHYQVCQEHFEKLEDIVKKCHRVIPELNKVISKERRKSFMAIISTMAAVIVIFSWLMGLISSS